jgi:hypothetical protein
MIVARANQKIIANWFPMALKGTTLSWLRHLPRESLGTWGELCIRFVSAFKGGFKCPRTLIQMHSIVQKEGERLPDFMLHFSQIAHTIPEIEDVALIGAFMMNVRDNKMSKELNMCPIRNTNEL